MNLYHLTSVKNLWGILNKGLLPFTCYEWCGLYDGIVPKDTPIIWFTDSIREKGSYLHPSRCLIGVDSDSLNTKNLHPLKLKDGSGWWIYTEIIKSQNIQLINWNLYRKQKPTFWDKAQNILGVPKE